jgi:hypothetical protein
VERRLEYWGTLGIEEWMADITEASLNDALLMGTDVSKQAQARLMMDGNGHDSSVGNGR